METTSTTSRSSGVGVSNRELISACRSALARSCPRSRQRPCSQTSTASPRAALSAPAGRAGFEENRCSSATVRSSTSPPNTAAAKLSGLRPGEGFEVQPQQQLFLPQGRHHASDVRAPFPMVTISLGEPCMAVRKALRPR